MNKFRFNMNAKNKLQKLYGGGGLLQIAEWVNLSATEHRFIKTSAEDWRLFTCQRRRFM